MKSPTTLSSLPAPFCAHSNVSKAVGGSEGWGDGGICVADWCRDCGSIGIRLESEERPDAWLKPSFFQTISRDPDELRLLSVLLDRLSTQAVEMNLPCLASALFDAGVSASVESGFLDRTAEPEYYCPDHKYNPPENSGMAFCPKCEFES